MPPKFYQNPVPIAMLSKKVRNSVFLFNASLLGIFITLDILANQFSERARKFPKFVLTLGILTITSWMIIYFVFPSAMKFIEAQAEGEESAGEGYSRYYRAWLCVALSVLTGSLFGFIFVVPTAFLSYGLILGDRRRWVSLVILMLVITAAFYIGFYSILNIPILQGILFDLG